MKNIRIYSVLFFLLLAFGVAGARLVNLHLIDNEFLKDQGDARSIRFQTLNAHRGMITDSRGKPLAISSPVISLWMSPSEAVESGLMNDSRKLAALADKLAVSNSELRKKIENNIKKEFVYLKRHLPPHEAGEIMALGIEGVYEDKEYQRFYPAAEIAAHIVGFTNIDDRGQEGIELAYDDWLSGKPGRKKVLKNLYGQIIKDVRPVEEAKPGKDLMISLDLRIQYLAYKELKSAISHLQAKSGSVVILDVETGGIVAMVNQPSFNPNNRQNLVMSAVRNRAVTDVFEPGSTVKPFTVAAALESGTHDRKSVIDTNPGSVQVGSKIIKDPVNRGLLSLAEIVAYSSQVGISKLALGINEYEVFGMFQSVGFGQATGLELPGESQGYLPNFRRWTEIDRVTFAYGYGLNVTPVQLASAYLTIATGGLQKQVTLISGGTSEGKRVLSPVVAADLKEMLELVISEGTGSRAKISSYTVAGKTGTAWVTGENGYEENNNVAFFAGMTPSTRPRLVGVVLINEPGTEKKSGGANAAPIFSRIMTGALKLLNVPPDQYKGAV